MTGINIANDSVALLTMLCTLLSAVFSQKRFGRRRSFFPPMLAAVGMDAATLLAWIAMTRGSMHLFFPLFGAGVVCYFMALALFICGIREYLLQRGCTLRWPVRCTVPVCALSAVAWLISNRSGMFYTIRSTGLSAPGPLYLLGQLGGYWVIAVLLILVLRHRDVLGRNVARIFAAFPVLPLLSAPLQMLAPGLHLMPLLLSAAFVRVYAFILQEQAQALQERQLGLTQNRIAISFSQIRPHFLYNTLNSIYYLCASDPKAAQSAIDDFTAYLRGNLESVEQETEVPLKRELEHVRHYLRLEQMRFGEELRVEYDIAAEDFTLPALTIQPLAENAVKHGLMPREGGGTVTIRTRETDRCYEITVLDDGVGYDPDTLQEDDRTHIGIRNVSERLRIVCRGQLQVESLPGRGTAAVIQIPKSSRRWKDHV